MYSHLETYALSKTIPTRCLLCISTLNENDRRTATRDPDADAYRKPGRVQRGCLQKPTPSRTDPRGPSIELRTPGLEYRVSIDAILTILPRSPRSESLRHHRPPYTQEQLPAYHLTHPTKSLGMAIPPLVLSRPVSPAARNQPRDEHVRLRRKELASYTARQIRLSFDTHSFRTSKMTAHTHPTRWLSSPFFLFRRATVSHLLVLGLSNC